MSREDILKSPVKTKKVQAFGGTVVVREMPAYLVRKLFETGVIETVTKNGQQVTKFNYKKFDFVELAMHVIVDDNNKPLMDPEKDYDIFESKAGPDIQNIVTISMNMTEWGDTGSSKKKNPKA